ncbi:MAG: hypothetical protein GF355_10940 [Candidatus Eisenbacteria bacterium]|nr:hypothetical protein [Candidatus Eisenbacteria bacterium]
MENAIFAFDPPWHGESHLGPRTPYPYYAYDPRWERYGRAPYHRIEEGNVFTFELGIENLDGRGYLGLEEMVVVTREGIRWLSHPQTMLPVLV